MLDKHLAPLEPNGLRYRITLLDLTPFAVGSYTAQSLHAIGQVAQLVERGPEKAGVGGSIPSLATTSPTQKGKRKKNNQPLPVFCLFTFPFVLVIAASTS